MKTKNDGAISILACTGLLLYFSLAGVLLYSLSHTNKEALLQLSLHRCTGLMAGKLIDINNNIQRTNTLLDVNRVAIVVAPPPARAALFAISKGLKFTQQLLLAKWKVHQIFWITSIECEGFHSISTPIPTHNWKRLPNDLLGPRPLRWKVKNKEDTTILFGKISYKTYSLVEIGNERGWNAKWTNRDIMQFQELF